MRDFDENEIVFEVYLHLILEAKEGHCVSDPASSHQIYHIITQQAVESACCVMAIGGIEDHVHILIKASPEFCLESFLRAVKQMTSIWLRSTNSNHIDFDWENDYSFSVSSEELEFLISKINDQKKIHESISLKEELQDMWEPQAACDPLAYL